VSGNVSFYNESAAMDESIPPTPTILGIGICEDVRECITVDVKEADGNLLYVIGETKAELGGSEYYKLRHVEGGVVPRTEPEASIDLAGVNPELRSDYKLFSESNTRWVVEVWKEEAERFVDLIKNKHERVRITKIGETIGEKRVGVCDRNKELVDLALEEVREAWSGTFG
jgi:phosphoribosylformylglycinamidine synthase